MDEKLNMTNTIPRLLHKMAMFYRKNFDTAQILSMSKVTNHSLKFVPEKRLEELFDFAMTKYEHFPDDKKLLSCWMTIKNSGEAEGYYDSWGTWNPEGKFYTAGSCPIAEWILLASNRAMELRIKFLFMLLTPDESKEWDVIAHKKVMPKRGGTQKPKTEWNQDDWSYHARFMAEFTEKQDSYRQYHSKMVYWCEGERKRLTIERRKIKQQKLIKENVS